MYVAHPRLIVRFAGDRATEVPELDPIDPDAVRFLSVVPHFSVPDVVRTAEYFRDVLGFEIAGYWDGRQVHHDREATVEFGIVRRDDVRVHLNGAHEEATSSARADGAYDVYCHLRGVDALAADCAERGADILDGPVDRVYGQRELIVVDCDGHVLAFGEEIPRETAL